MIEINYPNHSDQMLSYGWHKDFYQASGVKFMTERSW